MIEEEIISYWDPVDTSRFLYSSLCIMIVDLCSNRIDFFPCSFDFAAVIF